MLLSRGRCSVGLTGQIGRLMKVLLVDDHVLIREALRGVLTELRGDACVLEAADCRQTRQLVEQHPDLDLILLDLTLPDGDGFSLLAELRERYASIAVVVVSASNDRGDMAKSLDIGALGYIPKTTAASIFHPNSSRTAGRRRSIPLRGKRPAIQRAYRLPIMD